MRRLASYPLIVVSFVPAVSKRELGFAFFLSAGALLTGVLIANGAFLYRTARPVATAGVASGIVPSVAFASSRCWLPRTQLTDDQIWRVAAWGGFGIAILTVVDVAVVLVHLMARPIVDVGVLSLMSHVAIGGVAGVLVGTAWELNANASSLHERNSVLNRILRHNLRNDVNVIQGSTKLIRDGKGDPVKHAERISAKVDELLKVSEQVRRIQETTDPNRPTQRMVNAVQILEERLDLLRRSHPDVTIEQSLPDDAWVRADQLLDAVIDNVLENAIEHNEGPPSLGVEVARTETEGFVRIIITDNGPGIPQSELRVLDEGRETQLSHSTGTGLWLVKWYIEQNNGRLGIQTGETGTEVAIDLPAATYRPRGRGLLTWLRWFVRVTQV